MEKSNSIVQFKPFHSVAAVGLLLGAHLAIAAPVNDDFDYATVIPANPFPVHFTDSVDTGTASRVATDPVPSCAWAGLSDSSTIWYSYTALSDTVVNATANSLGSYFDTILAIYQKQPYSSVLNEIGCNDDSGINLQSEVSVTISAGQTVYIMLTGWGYDSGLAQFEFTATDNPRITADCAYFRDELRIDSLGDLATCKDGLSWKETQEQCYDDRLRYHAAVWVSSNLCPNDLTVVDLIESGAVFVWDGVAYDAAEAISIAETDLMSDGGGDGVTSTSAAHLDQAADDNLLDKCIEKYDVETCHALQ